jgi:CBS domain containing-hemolysin-like protein
LESDYWPALLVLALALLLFMLAVAAESGVIYLSRSRVWSMVGRNVPHAQALERYVEERHLLYSVLSFARTLTVLTATSALVYIAVGRYGASLTVLALTVLVAVVVLTELEALSRVLVGGRPERGSLILSPVIWLFRTLFRLPVSILEVPGRAVLRLRGVAQFPPAEMGEDNELLRLVELEQSDGGFEEEERQMIRAIVELEDTTAREIMVPRPDIRALSEEASIADVARLIEETGFSRIPLYAESIDHISGVIYAKDLIRHLGNGKNGEPLRAIARDPHFIPESKRLDELLTDMRQSKVHMAIVVDEYGGTAGLVTIEDLLEEIVGEIEDEHDVAKVTLERVSEDEAIVDARIGIDTLNEVFGLGIESEDFDTVGGLVYHELGKMPSVGDKVSAYGLLLEVLSVTGNRIGRLRVARTTEDQDATARPVAEPGHQT